MPIHWGPISGHPPITQSHLVPGPVLSRGKRQSTQALPSGCSEQCGMGFLCHTGPRQSAGPSPQQVPCLIPALQTPPSSFSSSFDFSSCVTSSEKPSLVSLWDHDAPFVTFFTLSCLLDPGSCSSQTLRTGTLSLIHPKTVAHGGYLY